jgi:hypothetical protein
MEDPDRPQMKIWRMRITCWIPKATNTHSTICNTHCFSTATMVAEIRLTVTLHVHCLSSLILWLAMQIDGSWLCTIVVNILQFIFASSPFVISLVLYSTLFIQSVDSRNSVCVRACVCVCAHARDVK